MTDRVHEMLTMFCCGRYGASVGKLHRFFVILLLPLVCAASFVACSDEARTASTPVTAASMTGSWEVTFVGDWGLFAEESGLISSEPITALIRNVDGLFSAEASWTEEETLSWDPGCTRVFEYSARADEAADHKSIRTSWFATTRHVGDCARSYSIESEGGGGVLQRQSPVEEALNGLWATPSDHDTPCTLTVAGNAITVGCPSAGRSGYGSIGEDSIDFTSQRGGGVLMKRRSS